jgi:predicted transcriptional regulator
MGRREEAIQLVREGNSPSRIAKLWNRSFKSVMGYLYQMVGERRIARYEIMQSMEKRSRDVLENLLDNGQYRSLEHFIKTAFREFQRKNCAMKDTAAEELVIYLQLRTAVLADMYELLRIIETNLHRKIREALVEKYGQDDWWRKGLPAKIRKELHSPHEDDPEPAREPYNYTTLIHLKEIYAKQWSLLCGTLPPGVRSDRRRFLADITRLNQIRNSVMHPVKGIRLKDDDFRFVQSLKDSLGITF